MQREDDGKGLKIDVCWRKTLTVIIIHSERKKTYTKDSRVNLQKTIGGFNTSVDE